MGESIKTVAPHRWTDGGDKVLVLKRINKSDRTTRNGFAYPVAGEQVEAPDWENPEYHNKPICGGGLHGWPWGMGIGEGSDYDIIGDEWVVIAAIADNVVGQLENGWKCKLRAGVIVYSGPFAGAWAMINCGRHRLIDAMARDQSVTNIASGDYSKAASSGDYSTAASSGNHSTAASSGNYSKAASSGDYSTAAQDGSCGIAACIGSGGSAMAGDNGLIIVCWWDESAKRYRACVGNVGEDGIKAGERYCVIDGKLSPMPPAR